MKNISVIIPVYNRAHLVGRAIDSVLRQTAQAFEILVIDDGSTDQTSLAMQTYGHQIKYIRQENLGVSAARNRGIKEARGDWLAFLDSDDEWLKEKLEQAYDFNRHNPHYHIFQSEELWIRNGRRVNPKRKHQKTGGWIFRESLPLCIVSPSAVLIQRTVFDRVGLFDEHFPVCEDYDLWLRILRHYPIGLDKRPGIIKYGGHADQLSAQYWGMDRWRILAMEKHLSAPLQKIELRKALLQEIIRKLAILISGAKKRGRNWEELEQKRAKYQTELLALTDKI